MLRVHLDGGFYLSQPAYKVMAKQKYGRFVFISSSAGNFGQPMEAHYAAAKTGLVGLSNVIAIEGAAHGILSNTVLPTGFSRMVTETVGDEKFLAESGFMRAIRPNWWYRWSSSSPAAPAISPTATTRRAPGATPASSWDSARAGWRTPRPSRPPTTSLAHLDEVSATEKFIVPDSIVDEVLEVCDRLGISAMPDNADVAFPEPTKK